MKKNVLIRLLKVFWKIRDENYPSLERLIREISYELGRISERTLKRDLYTLKYEFDLPIRYDRRRGGYYLTEKCNFPFPPLSGGEVITLLIATNLLHQFKGTPLEKGLENLEKKLEVLFNDKISLNPQELEMALSVPISYIKIKTDIRDVFEKIFQAIREKKRVQIEYFSLSSGEKSKRKIDPYHLYNFQGVWYFCGYCHLRNEVRDFALDRIEKIETLQETFELSKDFNIKNYLSQAFRIFKGEKEKIRIKFDSYQARWIRERVWHESQKIEELENGEIIFEIEANPEEIKRWILGYGSHAEVLEPISLREEIKKELEVLLEFYQKDTI
ncbi:MAG: helix-turn-helix transcriptional regulator [bacterium]